jgi:hypothetical protein
VDDSPGHATPDDPSGPIGPGSKAAGSAEAAPNAAGPAEAGQGGTEPGGAESDGQGDAGSDGRGEAGSDDHGPAGPADDHGPAGPADDDEMSGAVGVGTGGSTHKQSDSDGCTVRTGPAAGDQAGGAGDAEGSGAVGDKTGATGRPGAEAGARCRAFTGPAPSPVFEVAVAAGGNVPATTV